MNGVEATVHAGDVIKEFQISEADTVREAAGPKVQPDCMIAGLSDVVHGLKGTRGKSRNVIVRVVSEAVEHFVILRDLPVQAANGFAFSVNGALHPNPPVSL